MKPSRGALSCASCRQKKLKCDRSEPCANCVSRNKECTYEFVARRHVSSLAREAGSHLENRIRRLEELISVAAAQNAQVNGAAAAPKTIPTQGVDTEMASDDLDNDASVRAGEERDLRPGRMRSEGTDTTYVASTHWAAVYDEIANLRQDVLQFDGPNDLEPELAPTGPLLLEGHRGHSDIADILADLPEKSIADKLISRYFNSAEPAIVLIHAPTFQQQYKQFWQEQTNVSLPWLSMLFGMLSFGTFIFVRSQDTTPDKLGDPIAAIKTFQQRSADCLINSQYASRPTSYTMEALLLNIHGEFIRHRGAQLGVWVLAGVVIRLALRMGYHRDPKDFAQISIFDGEMRRRTWAIILQLDTMTSYQLGMPSMIPESQCDTAPPSNLHDEDFGPESLILPQSRPESELTPVLYSIAKWRGLEIFRKIVNRASTNETYEEIMRIDSQLRATHEQISPRFRLSEDDGFIVVSPSVLISRYRLELLFQKSRCLLHRHHMTKSFTEPKYIYSRTTCVEAAMAILKHQVDISNEAKPGGILQRDQWFISSLERHDFLLASMVICLELSYRMRNTAPGDSQTSNLKFTQIDLVGSLEKSREFWGKFKDNSKEALQAFNAVSHMLGTVSENPKTQKGQVVTKNQGSAEIVAQPEIQDWSFNANVENFEAFMNNPEVGNWAAWEDFLKDTDTMVTAPAAE